MKWLFCLPLAFLTWIPWTSPVEAPALGFQPPFLGCSGCERTCTVLGGGSDPDCKVDKDTSWTPECGFDSEVFSAFPICMGIDELSQNCGADTINLCGRIVATLPTPQECDLAISNCSTRKCSFEWEVQAYADDNSSTGGCLLSHSANDAKLHWDFLDAVSSEQCGGNCLFTSTITECPEDVRPQTWITVCDQGEFGEVDCGDEAFSIEGQLWVTADIIPKFLNQECDPCDDEIEGESLRLNLELYMDCAACTDDS